MIYYEISFPLTLIFKYIFVKILLMTFPFPFHEKLQIFLKIDRCLKEVIAQLHSDLYYNELVI